MLGQFLINKTGMTSARILVLFMLFGGAAGVVNVYRFAKSEERKR